MIHARGARAGPLQRVLGGPEAEFHRFGFEKSTAPWSLPVGTLAPALSTGSARCLFVTICSASLAPNRIGASLQQRKPTGRRGPTPWSVSHWLSPRELPLLHDSTVSRPPSLLERLTFRPEPCVVDRLPVIASSGVRPSRSPRLPVRLTSSSAAPPQRQSTE